MSAAASGGDEGGKGGGEKKMTTKEVLEFVDLYMSMSSNEEDELILKRLSESHPNPTLIKHAHDSSKSSEKLKEIMSAGVNHEPLMNKSRLANLHVVPNITGPLLQPQHVDIDDDKDDDDGDGEHHHKKKKQKIKNKDEDEGEGEDSKNQEEDGN